MPEVEYVHNGMRLVKSVVKKKRGCGHFANASGCVMERASVWHRAETERTIKQALSNPNRRHSVILRDKSHDTFEILKGRVRDQDFVIHEATEPFRS